MCNMLLSQVKLSLFVFVICVRYDMLVVCDGVGGSCHLLLPAVFCVVKRYVACFHSVVRMFNCNCKVCFKMWGCSLKLYFDCKLQA